MSSIYLQMHPEKANLFQPTPELEHELVNLMMDMLGICLHVALERRNRLEGEDAETIKKAVQEILPAVKVGMRWMVGASAHKERWNTILGHFDLWVALSNFLTALGPLADVEPMHSSPITLDEDLDFQGFLPFGEPSQELDSVEGDLVSDGTLGDAVDLRIIQIIRLGLNMAERKVVVSLITYN
ncbi:hypothetical protein HK101_001277 [Irineochytrium annulatum]|nr:hypothetical protein HK101_001277 [Irineochytrium annulatum]